MLASPTTQAPGLLAETFWVFCSPGSLESSFSGVIPQMPVMQPDFGRGGMRGLQSAHEQPCAPTVLTGMLWSSSEHPLAALGGQRHLTLALAH